LSGGLLFLVPNPLVMLSGRKKPWTSWRFFGLKKGAKGGRHSFGGLKRYLLSVSGQRKDRPGGFGSKNH
jgi:hypothetical protein